MSIYKALKISDGMLEMSKNFMEFNTYDNQLWIFSFSQ